MVGGWCPLPGLTGCAPREVTLPLCSPSVKCLRGLQWVSVQKLDPVGRASAQGSPGSCHPVRGCLPLCPQALLSPGPPQLSLARAGRGRPALGGGRAPSSGRCSQFCRPPQMRGVASLPRAGPAQEFGMADLFLQPARQT